jgi:hypothetical protein
MSDTWLYFTFDALYIFKLSTPLLNLCSTFAAIIFHICITLFKLRYFYDFPFTFQVLTDDIFALFHFYCYYFTICITFFRLTPLPTTLHFRYRETSFLTFMVLVGWVFFYSRFSFHLTRCRAPSPLYHFHAKQRRQRSNFVLHIHVWTVRKASTK